MESTNTRRSGNRESAGTCICPPRRRVFKSLPPVDNTGNGRFKSAPRCRIRMIWITLFRSCGIGVVVVNTVLPPICYGFSRGTILWLIGVYHFADCCGNRRKVKSLKLIKNRTVANKRDITIPTSERPPKQDSKPTSTHSRLGLIRVKQCDTRP